MSVVHPHLKEAILVREDHPGLHGDLGGPPDWQLQEPLELQQVHGVSGSRQEQVIPLEWRLKWIFSQVKKNLYSFAIFDVQMH